MRAGGTTDGERLKMGWLLWIALCISVEHVCKFQGVCIYFVDSFMPAVAPGPGVSPLTIPEHDGKALVTWKQMDP